MTHLALFLALLAMTAVILVRREVDARTTRALLIVHAAGTVVYLGSFVEAAMDGKSADVIFAAIFTGLFGRWTLGYLVDYQRLRDLERLQEYEEDFHA